MSSNISARTCCSTAPMVRTRWLPSRARRGTRSCAGRPTSSARASCWPKGSFTSASPTTRSLQHEKAIPADPWIVGALHAVTTLTGSALLALALMRGFAEASAIWRAAHVDEDWNFETWGFDDLAMSRRAAREAEFNAAALILKAMRG